MPRCRSSRCLLTTVVGLSQRSWGAVVGYIYAQATAGKPEVVEEQSMEELADEKAES